MKKWSGGGKPSEMKVGGKKIRNHLVLKSWWTSSVCESCSIYNIGENASADYCDDGIAGGNAWLRRQIERLDEMLSALFLGGFLPPLIV